MDMHRDGAFGVDPSLRLGTETACGVYISFAGVYEASVCVDTILSFWQLCSNALRLTLAVHFVMSFGSLSQASRPEAHESMAI